MSTLLNLLVLCVVLSPLVAIEVLAKRQRWLRDNKDWVSILVSLLVGLTIVCLLVFTGFRLEIPMIR